MKGDRFTADKFLWLDQVGADAGLTPFCFRLAYAIVKYLNRKQGDAWPSQERLAGECLVSESGVRAATKQLVERKHLKITQGNGRGTTSRYEPIIDGELWSERMHGRDTIDRKKAAQPSRVSIPKGATTVRERCHNGAHKGVTTVATIPFIDEPIEEPIERRVRESIPFDDWWQQYPRKTAKLKAEQIYQRVIKTGQATHAELLAGAMRYAAERDGQDPRYTKYPSTWLSAGCWSDEPAPRAPPNTQRADGTYATRTGFSPIVDAMLQAAMPPLEDQ